nr:MAG TPA: Transcription factor [Caudoviricetes sp.]
MLTSPSPDGITLIHEACNTGDRLSSVFIFCSLYSRFVSYNTKGGMD